MLAWLLSPNSPHPGSLRHCSGGLALSFPSVMASSDDRRWLCSGRDLTLPVQIIVRRDLVCPSARDIVDRCAMPCRIAKAS